MIYPRLDKIRNGQRMSVELVNGLIKRTEYTADLLRQYKPLAGTDISIAQRNDGTTISAVVDKYLGYIMPNVPSINDILLKLDETVEIAGGVLGGLFARDLPLNQRQKIVYPDFVLEGGYALRINGAYWANFNEPSNGPPNYLYPSIAGPVVGYTTLFLTSPPFPALGGHPNAGPNQTSFFEGGYVRLVKV